MVKSKKLSRGSLAVLLLALLLAVSMVVGMTGAWFTDKASQTGNVNTKNFGSVALSLDATNNGANVGQWSTLASTGNVSDVMPGSQIELTGYEMTYAGKADALVYVNVGAFTVTITDTAENSTYGTNGVKTLHLVAGTGETETVFDYFDVYVKGQSGYGEAVSSLADWYALTANAAAVKGQDANGAWIATGTDFDDNQVYLVKAITGDTPAKVLTIKDLKLVVKTAVTNQAEDSPSGVLYPANSVLYVPDNAQIAISYSIEVRAIQADNMDGTTAKTYFGIT